MAEGGAALSLQRTELLLGAEFAVGCRFGNGKSSFTLVALVHNLQGWGNLCEFITIARRAAPKGQYRVRWSEAPWHLLAHCEVLLSLPVAINMEAACAIAARARAIFCAETCSAAWLAVPVPLSATDTLVLHRLQQIAQFTEVPLVAAGDVRMHVRSRKPLHDVLTAVRLGKPVAQCGFELQANAEAQLRPAAALYPGQPNTLVVADRCNFSLDELRYHYPLEAVLPGHTRHRPAPVHRGGRLVALRKYAADRARAGRA